MTPDELKRRTKAFAVEIIKLAATIPTNVATSVVVRQLVKSGTSVGANYREACRAKSRADFVSKLSTAEGEADETKYWLEVLSESGNARAEAIAGLSEEAEQLVRILVASINTARGHKR